jgi:hypothetical protein
MSDKVNGVVFEPLPPRLNRNGDQSYGLAYALPQLRERPDEWARVREYEKPEKAAYVAAKVNGGSSTVFGKDFAACVRRLADGRHALYMRFTGDAEGGA